MTNVVVCVPVYKESFIIKSGGDLVYPQGYTMHRIGIKLAQDSENSLLRKGGYFLIRRYRPVQGLAVFWVIGFSVPSAGQSANESFHYLQHRTE